jgi:hypothetical protein
MRSILLILTSLALAGCSSTPIHLDAGNSATPYVSVVSARSEQIALQLAAPAYVAAVEVVYGQRVRVLMPVDSSGALPTGSHDVVFRAVGTLRASDRQRPIVWERFSWEGCLGGGSRIMYEPVPVNRAANSGVETVKSSERVIPSLCTSRQVRGYRVDGRLLQVGGPLPSRRVIVFASDRPIDAERLVENLTKMGSMGYAPGPLAQVSARAMSGHEGTWSVAAARR